MQDAYTVPSKVYVGDRASLVLPLPGFFGDGNTKIISEYSSEDIDIHQVMLERRPTGIFLTVEFSAYTPGVLELPPIEIAGRIFSGLRVEISSILSPDESGLVLSGPALPLAIPGSSLLVFGTMSVIILSLLLASWALLWGRKRLRGWFAAWKRKRLLGAMRVTERRLRRALGKGVDRRRILDTLSVEFRNFLTWFTGENYRVMTAAEICRFNTKEALVPDGAVLGSFFTQCDSIRFNGSEIGSDETLTLLDDLRQFLAEIAV